MLTFKQFLVEGQSKPPNFKPFGPSNITNSKGELLLGRLEQFYRRAHRVFNARDLSQVHVKVAMKDHAHLVAGDPVQLTGKVDPPVEELDPKKYQHTKIPEAEVVHPTKGTFVVSLHGLRYVEPEGKVAGSRTNAYNEEHGLKRVIEHFGKRLSSPNSKSLASLIHEVHSALEDKNHPLHFDNLPAHEFTKGKKSDPLGTNLILRNNTITAAAMVREFPKLVDKNTILTVTGSSQGVVSDFYKQYGIKQVRTSATPKTDLLAVASKGRNRRYSIKMAKGSQLMSSNVKMLENGRVGGEPVAVYHAAALEMVKHYPRFANNGQDHVAKINQAIQAISLPLTTEKLGPLPRKERVQEVQTANEHLERLHNDYPELAQHVAHEAGTGNYKFADEVSRPSHIVTLAHVGQGREKKSILPGLLAVEKISDHDWTQYGAPRVSLGKHSGTASWRIES